MRSEAKEVSCAHGRPAGVSAYGLWQPKLCNVDTPGLGPASAPPCIPSGAVRGAAGRQSALLCNGRKSTSPRAAHSVATGETAGVRLPGPRRQSGCSVSSPEPPGPVWAVLRGEGGPGRFLEIARLLSFLLGMAPVLRELRKIVAIRPMCLLRNLNKIPFCTFDIEKTSRNFVIDESQLAK